VTDHITRYPSRHEPWRALLAVLQSAGVRLGQNYPAPILELGVARDAALARWRVPQKKNAPRRMA
jgi:deoxyribodipyrimidine photo-lyase